MSVELVCAACQLLLSKIMFHATLFQGGDAVDGWRTHRSFDDVSEQKGRGFGQRDIRGTVHVSFTAFRFVPSIVCVS